MPRPTSLIIVLDDSSHTREAQVWRTINIMIRQMGKTWPVLIPCVVCGKYTAYRGLDDFPTQKAPCPHCNQSDLVSFHGRDEMPKEQFFVPNQVAFLGSSTPDETRQYGVPLWTSGRILAYFPFTGTPGGEEHDAAHSQAEHVAEILNTFGGSEELRAE